MFLSDYSSMNCAVRLMSCSHTFLVYVRILRRSEEKNMSRCRVRLLDPSVGPRIFIGVCLIAAFICGARKVVSDTSATKLDFDGVFVRNFLCYCEFLVSGPQLVFFRGTCMVYTLRVSALFMNTVP